MVAAASSSGESLASVGVAAYSIFAAGFSIPLPVLAVLMVVAGSVWAAPRGRRVVVAIPVAALVVLLLVAAMAGRNELANEAAEAASTAASDAIAIYEERCELAREYANSRLIAPAQDELAAALRSAPDDPPKHAAAACRNAQVRLEQFLPPSILQFEASDSDAQSPAEQSEPTPLIDAVQVGTERATDAFLDELVGGSNVGQNRELTIGPAGWLLLGLLVLFAIVLWARAVFWFLRRTTIPQVALDTVVDGGGNADSVSAFTAELRQRLFEQDLRSPSVPTGNLPDDIAGVIEESGVAGAKFAAKLLALLRRLFGADNVVVVHVTVTMNGNLCTAIVEMTDRRTGETIGIDSVSAPQNETQKLIQRIAATIKNSALGRRGSEQLPPWQRWTESALAAYLSGVDSETRLLAPLTEAEAE